MKTKILAVGRWQSVRIGSGGTEAKAHDVADGSRASGEMQNAMGYSPSSPRSGEKAVIQSRRKMGRVEESAQISG